MNASRQRKTGRARASSPVKKKQARFVVGSQVTFYVWEGSPVLRSGFVVEDGTPWVVVRCPSFGSAIRVRRAALKVLEGGK